MSDVELESEVDFDENEPLLDEHEDEESHAAAADPNARSDDTDVPDEPLPSRPRIKAKRWQVKTPRNIVLMAATMKFCLVSSGMLILIPLFRLIEDAMCHVYYEDDSADIIEEMKCKVDGVQTKLSSTLGWLGLVNSLMSRSPCRC